MSKEGVTGFNFIATRTATPETIVPLLAFALCWWCLQVVYLYFMRLLKAIQASKADSDLHLKR